MSVHPTRARDLDLDTPKASEVEEVAQAHAPKLREALSGRLAKGVPLDEVEGLLASLLTLKRKPGLEPLSIAEMRRFVSEKERLVKDHHHWKRTASKWLEWAWDWKQGEGNPECLWEERRSPRSAPRTKRAFTPPRFDHLPLPVPEPTPSMTEEEAVDEMRRSEWLLHVERGEWSLERVRYTLERVAELLPRDNAHARREVERLRGAVLEGGTAFIQDLSPAERHALGVEAGLTLVEEPAQDEPAPPSLGTLLGRLEEELGRRASTPPEEPDETEPVSEVIVQQISWPRTFEEKLGFWRFLWDGGGDPMGLPDVTREMREELLWRLEHEGHEVDSGERARIEMYGWAYALWWLRKHRAKLGEVLDLLEGAKVERVEGALHVRDVGGKLMAARGLWREDAEACAGKMLGEACVVLLEVV